jgi:hypothetical protein
MSDSPLHKPVKTGSDYFCLFVATGYGAETFRAIVSEPGDAPGPLGLSRIPSCMPPLLLRLRL